MEKSWAGTWPDLTRKKMIFGSSFTENYQVHLGLLHREAQSLAQLTTSR